MTVTGGAPGASSASTSARPINGGTRVSRNADAQTLTATFTNVGQTPYEGITVASPSAGAGWLANNRPSALVASEEVPGATGVSPGQHGIFEIPFHGNGLAAGLTTAGTFVPAGRPRSGGCLHAPAGARSVPDG